MATDEKQCTLNQRGYILVARVFSTLTWSAVTMEFKIGKVDVEYI